MAKDHPEVDWVEVLVMTPTLVETHWTERGRRERPWDSSCPRVWSGWQTRK